MNDLVVLVPGRDEESTVKGILTRHDSLGIKHVEPKIFVHPGRDPGCLLSGSEFLRPFTKQYAHALIMLDREGCGRENRSRQELEIQIETQLGRTGWDDRAAAIVIDPELEIWVWSDSPHLPQVLDWGADLSSMRKWLIDHGFLSEDDRKPERPKEAMEKILRMKSKPHSSAIYLELAKKVSLKSCQDPAFLKLKETLVSWFSA